MLRIVDDSDALAPGVTVAGRYTLERIVGEGGMGVVWAARHVLTHKVCALKFLKERRAQDPKSYERLLREARAACAVKHPNIAQVHDLLELPSGAPFIVMDLLEGESLSKRLERDKKLPPRGTLTILADTMGAVLAAHSHGIVHRDLKPDNVFLERDGFAAKVLDFGIAKQATLFDANRAGGTDVEDAPVRAVSADLSRSVTSTFSVLGTPRYMAPEQARADGKVGFPTDVWALGMIAFECATGSLPPALETPGRAETIRRELVASGVDREVAALIGEMLLEEPSSRPELAAARARVVRALDRNQAATTSRDRRPLAFAALAVAGLAAFGWFWRTRPEPLATPPAQAPAASTSAAIVTPTEIPRPPPPPAGTTTTPTAAAVATTLSTTASRPTSTTRTIPRASASTTSQPSATASHGIPTLIRD